MKIILDGVPISQSRMRHTVRGSFAVVYDPNSKDKKDVRLEILSYVKRVYNIIPKFINPRISFIFYFPILKSISKKNRPLYESGQLKHEKKPDVDNLLKFYLDCLDGIVFEGDQAIQLGSCYKLYHSKPHTIILINDTTPSLNHQEVENLYDLVQDAEVSDRRSF